MPWSHSTYGALEDPDGDQEDSSISSQESSSTTPDDFTSKVIGDFGKWQLRISILMALLKFPLAWYQLGIVFLAPHQNFWCEKPKTFENYSDEEWRDICKPKTEEYPCLIYDPELLLLPAVDKRLLPLVTCTKFLYDNSSFRSTIVSEWDLVCSRRWLVHLSQMVLMWGILMGNMLFGVLADKYGRKKPLMTAIVMQSVASFLSSLAPCYWIFVFNRFILALASGGITTISFVICMEIVGGKYRTIIPIIYQIPFGIGNTIMAVLAYYLRDWRKLEVTLACFTATYVSYIWFVPESPRWLLAMGKKDEAIAILKNAAGENHRDVEISPEIMRMLAPNKPDTKRPGFLAFLRYKNLRLKTILLSLNWLCTGLNFYAFSQYMGQIAANIFLTVALGGIISTPGSIICVFIVKTFGRKMALAGSQVFTALCFVMLLFVPKDVFNNDWPRILIAGLGLAGMAISVPALYLFTGELYPTLGRNVGVGGCSMFARVGSMMSPLLVSLEDVASWLPLATLAIFSVLQVSMVLPLPETKGCPLPDTIEQAEEFDKEFSIKYRRAKKRSQRSRKRDNKMNISKE